MANGVHRVRLLLMEMKNRATLPARWRTTKLIKQKIRYIIRLTKITWLTIVK